jgi:hypothetical protein
VAGTDHQRRWVCLCFSTYEAFSSSASLDLVVVMNCAMTINRALAAPPMPRTQ